METQTDQQTTDGGAIQQLRDKADQATALEQSNAEKDREIAFLKAGVKTDTPLGGMMLKSYDGALETEAIQEFQRSLGIAADLPAPEPGDPAPTTDDPVPGDPATPADALNQMGQSAAPGIIVSPGLLEEGFVAFEERLKAGATREDAQAEVINRIIHGAVQQQNGVEGYDGFIYDREAFQNPR